MDWRPIKAALTPAPEEDEVVENGWSVVWMDGWTDDILELKVNHQNMNKLFWGFVVVFLNPPHPPPQRYTCLRYSVSIIFNPDIYETYSARST